MNRTISSLIEKSKLTNKEKNILLTHIEIYEDEINSLKAEILYHKDIIDNGKYLDDNIMRLKEELLKYALDNSRYDELLQSYKLIFSFTKNIKEIIEIIDKYKENQAFKIKKGINEST